MHHIILRLPFGITIKSYGLMLMLGFFAATWWATYRAKKVKADVDAILNMGFIGLIAGVVGARLLFVIQFWDRFAAEPNPLLAALNITSGGLVFYGGFLLAMVCVVAYLRWKNYSLRLYFDILAPSLMLGLAFGRMGCFLNGCCWGAPTEKVPWAMRFPYGSPPFLQHWQRSLIDVPQQLLVSWPGGITTPISRDHIGLPARYLQKPLREYRQARDALKEAKASGADAEAIKLLEERFQRARQALQKHKQRLADLYYVLKTYDMTPSEVDALAAKHTSLPVHPTQLYSLVNAALIGLLLHAIFMRRKQQGIVFALLLIFYPISRFILEMIRGDNPLDARIGPFAVTMSQMISFWTLVAGVVLLIVLYRLPAASPRAVPYVPPTPQPAGEANS